MTRFVVVSAATIAVVALAAACAGIPETLQSPAEEPKPKPARVAPKP